METKVISLNGDTFKFELSKTKPDKDFFCHECILYRNGHRIASDRVHYINRTWESYEFETVMIRCARMIKNEELIAKLKIS